MHNLKKKALILSHVCDSTFRFSVRKSYIEGWRVGIDNQSLTFILMSLTENGLLRRYADRLTVTARYSIAHPVFPQGKTYVKRVVGWGSKKSIPYQFISTSTTENGLLRSPWRRGGWDRIIITFASIILYIVKFLCMVGFSPIIVIKYHCLCADIRNDRR